MDAVTRAITPQLYLSNVLEITDNLNLDKLMKVLQLHFVKRNTLDLIQYLTSLTHGQQESATQCIYREMSLKQKLALIS